MFKRGDKEFILDMWFSCKNILDYTEGISFDDFRKDRKTIDAVIRNISILGEAVKNISGEFQDKYSELKWNIIARTRDKLIHFYFGVDVEIVWRIIKEDISDLFEKLTKIIKLEDWEHEI